MDVDSPPGAADTDPEPIEATDDSCREQSTEQSPSSDGESSPSSSSSSSPPPPPQVPAITGPRPAPAYSVVSAIIEKKEDGAGSRCGHTLTAIAAVGEEGSPGYIGPRLILFGGATALEGNSAAPPSSAGSAGIRTFLCSNRLLLLLSTDGQPFSGLLMAKTMLATIALILNISFFGLSLSKLDNVTVFNFRMKYEFG